MLTSHKFHNFTESFAKLFDLTHSNTKRIGLVVSSILLLLLFGMLFTTHRPRGAERLNRRFSFDARGDIVLIGNISMKCSGEAGTDLAITKTDLLSRDGTGWKVTYKITVTNISDCSDAQNVRVVDLLPKGEEVNIHSVSPPCRVDPTEGEKINCVWEGATASGISRSAEIVVKVRLKPSNPTLCNKASVASDTRDDNSGNNFAITKTQVRGGRQRVCQFPDR